MLTKEPEMLQPDAFCEQAYNAAKCDCGRDSAPDPAGGAYSDPPDSQREGKGGKRKEGKGREREERGRERGRGRGGEVDSDVPLKQDRRLAKAGPGPQDLQCHLKTVSLNFHSITDRTSFYN